MIFKKQKGRTIIMATLEPGKKVNYKKDLQEKAKKKQEWLEEETDRPEIRGSVEFTPNKGPKYVPFRKS